MHEIFAEDDIPTKSELRQQLGVSLTQVLVDYSHDDVKNLLGSSVRQSFDATTPRSDIDDEMWPEKHKVLKSHVHHDILALGEKELKQFRTRVEDATTIRLRDEFAEKYHMFEAEKRFAIERNANEIHARYAELFKAAQEELREKLRIDWADTEAKHKKELQKAIVRARMDTTHEVLRRMRPQIFHVIANLYNDLELSYRSKRERMIADFNQIMRKHYTEMDAKIAKVESEKVKELRVQRRELEMRNITNIIYLVCAERLHCDLQTEALCKYFEVNYGYRYRIFFHDVCDIYKHLKHSNRTNSQNRIESLYEHIAEQNEIIWAMRDGIAEQRDKNAKLREKIVLITEEFRKFINFALDSVPEHADFLLPSDLSSADEEVAEQEKNR
ncbi:uncharacterized protein LOC109853686 isoform X1 [Pseudomyrmex gracilis]|uniref:uncharacterized protein LOC109853686 isoform X1 n=1 Tax=Pseudomyrmex gracilis TaxID=219809 RepID=UPI000994ACCF|nr:uncharacterized protein LOC109853686 isoform X1 [Pseudomyrmex gracilis]XP_020281619.1 uncharacterized protein LOC109853686 isoform X1 [Pseudomyrmex gracilis]XP_020281620.1 uncharacterized protein LOC109853686 isoform X1 [Pseudomyrmex gracilis]